MNIDTLRSLQQRIREATGPDRELDARLYGLGKGLVPREFFRGAMNWQFVHPDNHNEIYYVPFDAVSPYTADPDGLGACVALIEAAVPEANCIGFDRTPKTALGYVSRNYVARSECWYKEAERTDRNICLALIECAIAAKIAGLEAEQAKEQVG